MCLYIHEKHNSLVIYKDYKILHEININDESTLIWQTIKKPHLKCWHPSPGFIIHSMPFLNWSSVITPTKSYLIFILVLIRSINSQIIITITPYTDNADRMSVTYNMSHQNNTKRSWIGWKADSKYYNVIQKNCEFILPFHSTFLFVNFWNSIYFINQNN